MPGVIAQLDQEFVHGKHRSISLSERFSKTLSKDNIEQIRVAAIDGVIYGTLSVKRFDWVVQAQVWHGAMVGMVWVDVQSRGKGIGSGLLAATTRFLTEHRVDFGVLWTGMPEFYSRAGWFSKDVGLFGEVAGQPATSNIGDVSCQPLASVDVAWLEEIRSRNLSMRVLRSPLDYQVVPIPALKVLCFSACGHDGSEGYALAGVQDGTTFLYEMVAPPILWGPIWSAVHTRASRLFVNSYTTDPFARWLVENQQMRWQAQNKCMWLCLSSNAGKDDINTWHIPYYDWI